MREKLIAGNWKMNVSYKDSEKLAKELTENLKSLSGAEVALFPTYVCLGVVAKTLKGSDITLGAQDVHFEDDGAFTGAVSASIIKSVGCKYVIIGHSERRQFFHETDAIVNRKVHKALENGLIPIICVGETLQEREDGIYDGIVKDQVCHAYEGVSDIKNTVVAYEPVWAIGTGKNATPKQAESMHKNIRRTLAKLYSQEEAQSVRIIYGGSVKPDNTAELFKQEDIDGALVGGASLQAGPFTEIVKAAITK